MTLVMTVAPAPINIHLAAGAKVRDPEGYARFWERVAAEHRSPGLTFCHARQADRSPRYGTLRTDSLQRSLEVVSGGLDPSELSCEPTPECAPLWECVTAVRFWWYDHAILVVGLEAEVGTWLGSEAGSPAERLDALQEQIIALTCGATAAIVEQRIRPIVTTARRLDPDGDFLDWPELDGPELDGPESQGADDANEWSAIAPRWVARSLVLDRDEPGTDLLARHWLADGGDPAAVEEWVAGELTHVSRWLNYVHAGRRDDTTTVLTPTPRRPGGPCATPSTSTPPSTWSTTGSPRYWPRRRPGAAATSSPPSPNGCGRCPIAPKW